MTIPKECKRLAEVDFPIVQVSEHSIRERPLVHKHPQSLHQWWARRPLASSRAVLMSLLLPDPLDPLCPTDFKIKAFDLLGKIQKIGEGDANLRTALLKFIGNFASWELVANQQYLNIASELVKIAHLGETPVVADPFAGGGSIPLEALRLRCDSYASDLNPVAVLINKVILELVPRFGKQKIKVHTIQGEVEVIGLAEALTVVGAEIKNAAKKELSHLYPADIDGALPIAYLWARTVRCESPNCGAEIPLVRSFWLCKKSNRRLAIHPSVIRDAGKTPRIEFNIYTPISETEVPLGTVKRANAKCLCCQTILPAVRVRVQLTSQKGGADPVFDNDGHRMGGSRLLAIVTLRPGEKGRHYRLPTESDYLTVQNSIKYAEELSEEILPSGISLIPNEPTPSGGGSGAGRAFSVQKYGMNRFSDLFTSRQKATLAFFVKLNLSLEYEFSILNALVISRLADRMASLVGWDTGGEKIGHVFNRQVLPIVWDFAESCPFADATGSYENVIRQIVGALEGLSTLTSVGQAEISDAAHSPLPSESVSVWFTDPPYYDAVPYADLSDFFFVWLKRALPNNKILKDPFNDQNKLTPKIQEAVQDEMKFVDGKPKDKVFFESKMAQVFCEGRRVLREDGIGCVVFAHKTTEGWESLLGGMIKGGWTITGSWPIATERANRLRSQDSAALATSIHLICRPRLESANIGDWTTVSLELPRKVGDWMKRLQSEGLRGADLVFACIGPALEIYSRYSKVMDAQDREIPLGGDPEANEPYQRGYLAYVWETVGRLALEQVLGSPEAQARNGNAGALEEDSRLTALFLWTMQSAGSGNGKSNNGKVDEKGVDEDEEDEKPNKSKAGFKLIYDVARRFAQPLGIHLEQWEGRIIETEKGVVRLIPITERASQLFGEEGAPSFVSKLERNPSNPAQLNLFPEMEATPRLKPARARAGKSKTGEQQPRREATTLDRLHATMLLQKNGQATALRAMLHEEMERSGDFLLLANSLSALYPRESEEKRLLDAMLVNIKR